MPVSPATFSPDRPLRLGTRRSPLALAQAELAAEALVHAHGLPREAVLLVPMIATGDRVQDRALAEIGGKALWTRELDHALAGGEIDASVHSMKDVETLRPDMFALAAMLPRADVRDRLLGADSLAALPQGARVGTASPRRRAQLLHYRPDLRIGLLRGNVGTRISKLAAGEIDATLLAAAGLDRLSMVDVGAPIPVEQMLPAASQGAIGIEVRSNDGDARAFVAAIDHADTHDCVGAERAFLEGLGADCHSPLAALGVIVGDQVHLRVQLLSEDGALDVTDEARIARGDRDRPVALAAALLDRAPEAIARLFAR